jgi:hypothetical protein
MYHAEDTGNAYLTAYNLPDLPEAYDGADARQLVVYFSSGPNITLGEPVSLADAKRYCRSEGTGGPGWFVGFIPAS